VIRKKKTKRDNTKTKNWYISDIYIPVLVPESQFLNATKKRKISNKKKNKRQKKQEIKLETGT
jgi:hypothetical protein